MTRVSPRSRRHEDRAGDPLDGLVNMFDVGIVLAVGFLLAALASLNLTGTLTRHGLTRPADTITVPPSAVVRTVPPSPQRTVGRGHAVGKVYRLDDGRLVYVIPKSVLPTAPRADAGRTALMSGYWGDAFSQAWDKIVHGDPYLMHVIWVTIKVAAIPTVIATLVGLPIAVALGIGRFRGRGVGIVIANAGLGLPPVIVGLVFVLLTLPTTGPLGSTHLIFTLHGVYVVQTVLALPVIVALSSASMRAVPPGLFDQARAFGANRIQVATLALREARVGILAAVIAAVGSALSEVGAVVLAGANIQGYDQTLASAALQQVDAGNFVTSLAIGIVLLGLILVVTGALTILQHRGGQAASIRNRA